MPKSNTGRATARERELYRYFQPSELSGPDSPAIPQSASDPCLTAFAQLGALRLNARRGLITLSSRDTEYILAEASRSISLQQDDDKEDRLWHGAGFLKKNRGLGSDLVKLFCNPETATSYVMINDLTKDDIFKDKCVVVGPPFVRALASVPLISPLNKMVIGAYTVVDDKPRGSLDEAQAQFMKDMSITIMDYLEAGRLKNKEYRAERMVKAIGLFIEGKETLREWWLEGGYRSHHATIKKRARKNIQLEDQANAVFGVQDPEEEIVVSGMDGLPQREYQHFLEQSPSISTLSNLGSGDGRPEMPNRDSIFSSSNTTVLSTVLSQPGTDRPNSVTTFDTDEPTPIFDTRHPSVAFELPHENESKDLQEALLTREVKTVFSRASNLIREAVGVSGVAYFDASISLFAGSVEKEALQDETPDGYRVEGGLSTSEDEIVHRFDEEQNAQIPHQTCNILGYSTRKRSSLRGHSAPQELRGFPEIILRKLLKRYPHGKIFYFDDDGAYSSADPDEIPSNKNITRLSSPSRTGLLDGKMNCKRVSKEEEAAALLAAFPGARSIFWFPLWDQSREQWFSGSFVWSTCPTRVLCPHEDLAYMAAFGNSTMAEVSRLSAQRLSQMKSDFISSISHELRSPLHGILASVEFLQETSMNEMQADMVDNIQASGKVLLDTINHVLDFSKVNKRTKDHRRKLGRRTEKRQKKSSNDGDINMEDRDDLADVCILSEEVVESIYSGRKIRKVALAERGAKEKLSAVSSREFPVTVILDMQWFPNWTFEVDAGAWRRVVMNLFSNSMKYTKSGFVKISLKVEAETQGRSQEIQSILSLVVKDSGKGISTDFLKHRLYKAFTQEDELAEGAGLGLSIVRQIVHDMRGQIEISSEQGTGTEATVRIPLKRRMPLLVADGDALIEAVKKEATGLKYYLEGFDRMPDISETPTGILSSEFQAAMFLKSSVITSLTDWFGMEVTFVESTADVVVIMEAGITSMGEKFELYSRNRPPDLKPLIAIILCSSYHSNPISDSHGSVQTFYLQQPYGPHKIAKVLHNALFQSSTNIQSENPPPPAQDMVLLKPQLRGRTISSSFDTHDWAADRGDVKFDDVNIASTLSLQPSAGSKQSNGSQGMRVLLVEDNEINLKLLVAYMRKLKLDHATACNGLEALNAYKDAQGSFDVIFMGLFGLTLLQTHSLTNVTDISMPVMSGIESTRHIRRFENEAGLHPVALIALTGAANPTTRQEAYSSGVDLFLTKPVPMKSLKVMLDDLKANGRKSLSA